MKFIQIILVAVATWFGSSLVTAQAKTKLTKGEVQQIIIGKSWHNKRGTFVFRSNGTYQYDKLDGSFTFRGSYTLKSNGLVKGKHTGYRFYRKSDGSYQYYHTKSRRYFPVIFN